MSKTRALLLGRVAYGETDLVVTLFTETLGRIAALARAARRSTKRFGGALEPMHTLKVALDERPHGELLLLREATIETPRLRLTSHLGALQSAGKGLNWVRRTAPPRTQEPSAWQALLCFLQDLEHKPDLHEQRLVELGLRLLEAFGWGLDLERCVRCGKACPPERVALVSPERGGLVCRTCGGGPLRLAPHLRRALSLAAIGHDEAMATDDLPGALALVERALTAHMGVE